jgi:acyl carrier protein phosphodiesterase
MNILAHLYLSGDDESILTGNFIADFVKGKQVLKYPKQIALGIRVHREIDNFTDQHPVVKDVNKYFREGYGKHAGIVTDIVFDHYLSNNWPKFSSMEFDGFVEKSYRTLNQFISLFPDPVLELYHNMVLNNWLKMYQSKNGLRRVLRGMAKHTSLPAGYDFALEQVEKHDEALEMKFIEFFNSIIMHINGKFGLGISKP